MAERLEQSSDQLTPDQRGDVEDTLYGLAQVMQVMRLANLGELSWSEPQRYSTTYSVKASTTDGLAAQLSYNQRAKRMRITASGSQGDSSNGLWKSLTGRISYYSRFDNDEALSDKLLISAEVDRVLGTMRNGFFNHDSGNGVQHLFSMNDSENERNGIVLFAGPRRDFKSEAQLMLLSALCAPKMIPLVVR